MKRERATYLMICEITFQDTPQAMIKVKKEMRKIRELAMQKSTKGKLRIWKVVTI